MSFKTATVVLASAVATSGTFTVSYPADTTAGDYAPFGHYIMARGLGGVKFSQDAGTMSVSFGASDITVTYLGATSLPAGKTVVCHFNIRGQDDALPFAVGRMKRMAPMLPVRIELGAPDTADSNGILESQDLTAAGVFSVGAFDGVYGDPYGNDYAVLDVPRNVVAAWTTNAVLTITGKDEYGDVMVEASAGGGATFTGKKAFKTITNIDTDTSITALTVGTGDVLGLPVYVSSSNQIWQELQDNVQIGGFSSSSVLVPFSLFQTELLAPTAFDIVSPVAGYITGIRAVVQAAVTTGGAITVEANTVAVVGLSVTVADGATAGTTYTDTVLKIATGLVAAGDDITVTPAAAFATAGAVDGYIIIEPLAAGLDGTFGAGVQTTPTATTGDVRGTYDPGVAMDGAVAIQLAVFLADPTYKGVDQYAG
jgi:hypothetical protein